MEKIDFDYVRSAKNWDDFYSRIMGYSIIVEFSGGDWQEFMEDDYEHGVIGKDRDGNCYSLLPHDIYCQTYSEVQHYTQWSDFEIVSYLKNWEKGLKPISDMYWDSEG